jgi:exo-beta-1,3-glucanase (GH17 family)
MIDYFLSGGAIQRGGIKKMKGFTEFSRIYKALCAPEMNERWGKLNLMCLVAVLLIWFLLSFQAVPANGADLNLLRNSIADVCFAAYTPRAFSPSDSGAPAPIPASAIAQDINLLRDTFDGLITYSTSGGMESLPALAAVRGYRALILGVWNPSNVTELNNAIELAGRYPKLVVGICIGNEGLFSKRYTQSTLQEALEQARRRIPNLPLGTSEPFAWLLNLAPGLLTRLDFLLPNIHPLTETWFAKAPEEAAWQFVINVANMLKRHGKPIVIKETGLPSAPITSKLTPERQARFWRELLQQLPPSRDLTIAAFEAFDAPWKPAEIARHYAIVPPGEDSWGFFTASGAPKPVVDVWRQVRMHQKP